MLRLGMGVGMHLKQCLKQCFKQCQSNRIQRRRTPRYRNLVGAVIALSLGCSESANSPADTSTGGTGGEAGEGGAPADSTDAGGSAGSGTGGTAGTAGAGGEPLTCDSFAGFAGFSDDDPHDRCEPKLRALLSSRGDEPLLQFEYNAAGQIARIWHEATIRHLYSYDAEGRLVRLENDYAEVLEINQYSRIYEFSYADAGWVQTLTRDGKQRTTYDEDGRVLETMRLDASCEDPAVCLSGTLLRYRYRSDGQIEALEGFDVDDGVETPTETAVFEYGDDGLLDEFEDGYSYHFEHVLEDGRVRVEEMHDELLWETVTIFDDAGRPAFKYDVDDENQHEDLIVFVGDVQYRRPVTRDVPKPMAGWFPRTLHHTIEQRSWPLENGIHAIHTFPYRPFELTETDIDEFSYDYERRGVVYSFARHPSFAADGRLEHLTLSANEREASSMEIDVLRCGGAVVESIDFSQDPEDALYDADDEVRIYYYGCDDFELPTTLPEL